MASLRDQLLAGIGPFSGGPVRVDRLWFELEGRDLLKAAILGEANGAALGVPVVWLRDSVFFDADVELTGLAERQSLVLAQWHDEASNDVSELVSSMLDALLPPPSSSSMVGWTIEHGLSILRGTSGAVAEIEHGEFVMRVLANALSVDLRFRHYGAVTIDFVTERRDRAGTIVETYDQPLTWFVAAGLPAPDPLVAPLSGWLADWRAYLGRSLARGFDTNGCLMMPVDLFQGRNPFDLMRWWLLEGNEPVPAARLQVTAESVTRARGQLELCDPAAFSLAELPAPRAAIALGADRIVALSDGNGNDWLLLCNGATSTVLLRADDEAQNRCLYTIDGDSDAMRGVLRWLADLVRSDDEELARWLEFRGERYDPDEPRYHPRLDLDRLVDVTDPYWDSNDPYLVPPPREEQLEIAREHVPRYYGFVRRHIDPHFVGLRERR